MQARTMLKIAQKYESLTRFIPVKFLPFIYSKMRQYFMDKFYRQLIANTSSIPLNYSDSRILWGIKFGSALMNAAGMFKNGEGYDLVAFQGAGGYIGGTSTTNPRSGNIKCGVKLPFISLSKSDIAVNFLGLPNLGDEILSKKLLTTKKVDGCPIGWSVMRSPDYEEAKSLELLVQSLFKYQDNLQIDFIEINESCPNVKTDFSNLDRCLEYIAQNFLVNRSRRLPVIIKLSNDIHLESIPSILDLLFKYRFDGVNLGNTSTNYSAFHNKINNPHEKKLFDYFTTTFGGGVSGTVLKSSSLELCSKAVNYRNKINPDYEFHVIRTGGIDSMADIIASNAAGISLNQWYTGYFKNYANFGNSLYQNL